MSYIFGLTLSFGNKKTAMPWLRWLDNGLSLFRTRFILRPVLVGFVVIKLPVGQVFSVYFNFLLSAPFYLCFMLILSSVTLGNKFLVTNCF
jgi:hypothetical protein